MERDSIVSFAKSKCNWTNQGYTEQQIVNEINKETNLGVKTNDWCAAFVCYVYSKCGCASKISNTGLAKGLVDNNQSISYKWPSDDSSHYKRLQVMKSLAPGDIIVWNRSSGGGHAGIIISITSGTTVDDWKITTVEGNSSSDVIEHNYSYPFKKQSYLYGFVCPILSGTGTTSSVTGSGNYFTIRNDYNPNVQLRVTDFTVEDWEDDNYQFSYYITKDTQNAPGLNTQAGNSIPYVSLPSMSGYCQGRAREVWDNQYPFQFGYDEPDEYFKEKASKKKTTVDQVIEYNYYYCSKNQTMYQRKPSAAETDDSQWEVFYSMTAAPIYETPSKTLFQSYSGYILQGTPHEMFRNAVAKGMSIQTAYNQAEGVTDYSRFNNTKNEKCVPKTGSIVVWADHNVQSNLYTGYCAFVEKVKTDELIYVTMSGREDDIFFEGFWVNPYCFSNGKQGFLGTNSSTDFQHRKNRSGVFLLGYIYPPNDIEYSKNPFYFIQSSTYLSSCERTWVI